MSRLRSSVTASSTLFLPALAVLATVSVAGCSSASGNVKDAAQPVAPLAVQTARVGTESITRTVRVTGSLIADEQAEVSAEVNGRVVATPV